MRGWQWKIAALALGAAAASACVGFNASQNSAGAGGAGGAIVDGGAGPATTAGNGGTGNGKNVVDGTPDDNGSGTGGTHGTFTTSAPGSGGAGGEGGGGELADCADSGEPRIFYMSSDDSSSMGSPALARELLNAGKAPPPAVVRTYEFLNYYRVRYPAPGDGLLDVAVHFAPVPKRPDTFRLQVGVQGFDVERPPMALTFVVDTSGSLVGQGIVRERAALRAIAKQLRPGDLVSLVVWAAQNATLLAKHEVSGPDDPTLVALADDLVPNGGSDLHSGLKAGYALAKETFHPNRLSRVVLISDGGANVGVVDRERIAQEAKHGEDQGIYLVGIGVGPAEGYSDTLMNLVTDEGRGSYVYLDSEAEAERVLGGRFDEVMDIAARSVEVKLTLPSYFEIQSTSAEQVSTNKEDVRPQHLAPGDSMVFHQYLRNVATSSVCKSDIVTVGVTWQDPALHPSSAPNEDAWAAPLSDLTGEPWQLLKAEAIVLYATALKTRLESDFEEAQAAVDRAQAVIDELVADGALTEGEAFEDELDEIEALLAKFPESEKLEKPAP